MPLFEGELPGNLSTLGVIWDRLACAQPQYVPSFSDLERYLIDPQTQTRVIGWREGSEISALAIFLVYNTHRRFWLGERPVLRIPARVAVLFGSASVGAADLSQASAILERVAADRSIDLITFADVPQSDFFHELASSRAWHGPRKISRHRATRRLALLPPNMEDYWAQLRPTTRKAALRDLKMFDRLGPTYTTFQQGHEMAHFLSRAAKLSAITYQQQLGLGVEDDAQTLAHFSRLASEGRMRGYIASIDGKDIAFIWGDISHGVFYFRTTGFDPDFARYSPGKAVLFWVIRDLIDSQAAHTFDFSGRDMDFKKRFSTSAVPCANFIMTRWSRPRGVALVALDTLFEIPKALAARLLGNTRLERLRRMLRR